MTQNTRSYLILLLSVVESRKSLTITVVCVTVQSLVCRVFVFVLTYHYNHLSYNEGYQYD
jgi:hypothetical protein